MCLFERYKGENPSHPWWLCETSKQAKNMADVVRELENILNITTK
jgi:hypothetical protein